VTAAEPRTAQLALRGRGYESQVFGDRLHVWVTDARPEAIAEFVATSGDRAGTTHVRPVTPSLEDVYIARLTETQQ
jgi:hypothetical protein